jgi:cytosine deaminase
MLPDIPDYWLRNVRLPESLIGRTKQGKNKQWSLPLTLKGADSSEGDCLLVDIQIADGTIASIATAGALTTYRHPSIDLNGQMVLPCFVDMHTHLDKGHIWNRAPNPDGTFKLAIATVQRDAAAYWDAEDLYQRMEFGLKCSYAHGTKAIRTHIDSLGEQAAISLGVIKQLQTEWRERLILQAVSLVPLDYFLTSDGEKIADLIAEVGGVLGGVAYINPDLNTQVERVFSLAKDRKLNLDFHVDENDDPNSNCLDHIAKAAIRHKYQGRVVCGHCCSLAVQAPDVAATTIKRVKQAGIGIVSLPMCNLYLQGRRSGKTPYWRGVTLLHELKQAGVPVAIASDNCRDPFHAFGDHDALEVFSLSVKIAHLDRPYGDWCRAITSTPADLMALPTVGRIGVGLPADMVIFKARSYSELLSRSQHDRIVLRDGMVIDTTLPDYSDLDNLQHKTKRAI